MIYQGDDPLQLTAEQQAKIAKNQSSGISFSEAVKQYGATITTEGPVEIAANTVKYVLISGAALVLFLLFRK